MATTTTQMEQHDLEEGVVMMDGIVLPMQTKFQKFKETGWALLAWSMNFFIWFLMVTWFVSFFHHPQ